MNTNDPETEKEYTPDARANKANKALAYLQMYVTDLDARAKAPANSTVDCVKIMDECNTLKSRVAEMVKSPLEKTFDTLRFAIVPARMEAENITAVTVEGIGRCNSIADVQVKTLDKGQLFEWLKENEFEDLITENVNAQTLAAFIRGRVKEGKPIPSNEIVDVTPIQRAQITRS